VVTSAQAEAENLYRDLQILYASDEKFRSLPLSHIWGEGSPNMGHLRQSLTQRPPEQAPTPPSAQVIDMTRNDRDVTARTIDLSIRWYERYFEGQGIKPNELPPEITPTKEIRQVAIDQDYPVIALGRYEHFHTTLLLEKHCLGDPRPAGTPKDKIYVEIGAIYGALARILIPRHPEITYVFVDIPESLCVTMREIRSRLPNARIFAARQRGDVANLNFRDFDVVFVPTILFEELAAHNIEVFAGFHTFGEMSNKYIAYYFQFINEKLRPRWIVSRNRFLSFISPNYFHRLGENMASVLCDENWSVEHWDCEPEILKCPYLDTRRHPRYLEFVLKRSTPWPQSEEISAKQECLRSVMIEGWVEVVSLFNNMLVSGHRQLRHDTTTHGTLFRLWNSIRCSPGRDNILVMLNYLDYLSGKPGQFAEEWFFYAGVLKRLHETFPDSNSKIILDWLGARARSENKSVYAASPGFGLGQEVLGERLTASAVREIMYATANEDLAALSSPI
jgi:hypothetical protein